MVKPPLRTKSIGFKVSEEEYAPGATSPFTYDQYDNLTKAGSMAWSPGYDPNTNHYQLAGTSYDLSGNVMNGGSNSYTWDPFNKMSSVSSTACGSSGCTATYDAFGRMVEFSKNSNYKENWYTQAGVAVMSGTTLTESYLGAPGGGTFMEVGTGGQNDYLHKDWLGNVRIASLIGNQTVGADLAYAPYGEVYNFISGSNIDTMFTGDLTQLDAGVLFDTPNRELAASNQGRWLSPDPAGAGWNQYGYMTNPLNSIDPSGLACYPLEKLIFNNCAAFIDNGVGFGESWNEFNILFDAYSGSYEVPDPSKPWIPMGVLNDQIIVGGCTGIPECEGFEVPQMMTVYPNIGLLNMLSVTSQTQGTVPGTQPNSPPCPNCHQNHGPYPAVNPRPPSNPCAEAAMLKDTAGDDAALAGEIGGMALIPGGQEAAIPAGAYLVLSGLEWDAGRKIQAQNNCPSQ
jgi:RHS repeat-associated protein